MKSHNLIHIIHKAMHYVMDMAQGKGGKKTELTPIQREVFLQFLRQAGAQEESGKQLAAKCGVSQPTITNALRGKGSPSMATVRAIAAYLGVSETDIIGGAEPPPEGLAAPPISIADVAEKLAFQARTSASTALDMRSKVRPGRNSLKRKDDLRYDRPNKESYCRSR